MPILGFDPLGIVKTKKQLFALREAEIKHARIAMLAAIGWPSSELCHYTLAKMFGKGVRTVYVLYVLCVPYVLRMYCMCMYCTLRAVYVFSGHNYCEQLLKKMFISFILSF
jgi:Chlorophyll A-B binding protein